ncbi:MAG TPA: hypothetical protein VEF04_18525, partial [Blastocatellia bacterium]|nr:hypothetical protein [Blastocatellia bacterium]
GWSGIFFQCPNSELQKPLPERKLAPLYCLGGNFSGAQLNWPTIEKEAYAIKRSVIICHTFLIFA